MPERGDLLSSLGGWTAETESVPAPAAQGVRPEGQSPPSWATLTFHALGSLAHRSVRRSGATLQAGLLQGLDEFSKHGVLVVPPRPRKPLLDQCCPPSFLDKKKRTKRDSLVPGRRLSQPRGGEPDFVRTEFMLDLWSGGTSPALEPRVRPTGLCPSPPSCRPSTGGLLPHSAPVLMSPAESVCTENHGALSPANSLPSDAGPLGAVYFNIWTAWPRFALCFLAGGFLPLDFPFLSTHSLPGTDFSHGWLPGWLPSLLSQKATPRRPLSLQSQWPAAALSWTPR